MGRKRREPKKKKKGGMLIGMRGGFQKAAKAVGVGAEKDQAKDEKGKKPRTRMDVFWNVVTVALLIVTAVILLRRFGVIHF